MRHNLFQKAQQKAQRAAKTAALGAVASICLITGLGFLTAAAWMVLTTLMTPTEATLVLGGGFTGIALVLFAIAASRHEEPDAPDHLAEKPSEDLVQQVIAAFLSGLQAGRQARH